MLRLKCRLLCQFRLCARLIPLTRHGPALPPIFKLLSVVSEFHLFAFYSRAAPLPAPARPGCPHTLFQPRSFRNLEPQYENRAAPASGGAQAHIGPFGARADNSNSADIGQPLHKPARGQFWRASPSNTHHVVFCRLPGWWIASDGARTGQHHRAPPA